MATTNPMMLYGSFRDCLKTPIHRWFAYPAGYSHKLVQEKILENALTKDSLVADPFVGTGTTSLAARMAGVPSLGIEAHPFVNWVANVKLCINYDIGLIEKYLRDVR